jgi:hypothetical protein
MHKDCAWGSDEFGKEDWMLSGPLEVSRYCPSLEKDIMLTVAATSSVCSAAPVAASQSQTVPQSNADASCLPSDENATEVTLFPLSPQPSSV